jgi:competence protein ComEC
LLLINPNNLFAMGFQLSYGAVVGIVLLQKPIYNIIYVKNKWLDKAWEVTAVSLAAQVATMPFTVYYFNQFTPYFWLSNLLMTPLSFIVILTGMTLLAVSWVPWLNIALGKVVWLSLHVMNMVVASIERLPLSLVKGLYLSDFQFGLSLLLLLLLWLLVNLKRKRMVMEMLVVASAFAMSLAWRSQQLAHQSQVVVYSLRNHTAISIVDGFDQVLLCDETLLEDPSAIDYSLKGFWAERQLPMSPRCYLLSDDFADRLAVKRSHLVSTQGKLLAFWNPDMYYGEGRLKVDYLLVRSKQTPDLKRILYVYQVGELIIDGSVPEYLAEEWIRQAESMGVPYRNVRKGALFV